MIEQAEAHGGGEASGRLFLAGRRREENRPQLTLLVVEARVVVRLHVELEVLGQQTHAEHRRTCLAHVHNESIGRLGRWWRRWLLA